MSTGGVLFVFLSSGFFLKFRANRLCKSKKAWQYKFGSVEVYEKRNGLTSGCAFLTIARKLEGEQKKKGKKE